jgi:glycosyltransferase involved in cell wall biosynthesis
MHKVSVIIPTFNSASTIVKSLESVINQTTKPSEVIVSDNGSSDDTLELVRRVQLENKSININITTCFERGAGPNRNHAVSLSTEKLLAFLDADDIWDRSYLDNMITESLPSNCIKGAYARYFNGSGFIFGQSIRSSNDEAAKFNMVNHGSMPFLLSSWIMNRDRFQELGGFDADYVLAQDFDFMYRHLLADGIIQVQREPLLSYRIHTQSETSTSHHLQRLTARYILNRNSNMPLSIEEYLIKNSSKFGMKLQSLSDIYVRKFIARQISSKISRLDLLIIAFCFSPIRFSKKIISQRQGKFFRINWTDSVAND